MPKDNFISKKLKKIFLSINDSIESYFNKFKGFKLPNKKTKLDNNIKAFIVLVSIFVVVLSYLTIPSFYSKNNIQEEIKNQFLKKYKIDIKFNQKISYSVFPKPHFYTKNLSILHEKNIIGDVENLTVFIKIKN